LDREKRLISALDGSGRSVEAYVAGPAALLCAKAYKLRERLAEALAGGRDRVKPKDAADVWRLMMVSEPERARSVFADGERDVVLGDAIGRGRSYLEELFGPDGDGTELV
jgi:predicted nucleotidyltransferase component of viral defense system